MADYNYGTDDYNQFIRQLTIDLVGTLSCFQIFCA